MEIFHRRTRPNNGGCAGQRGPDPPVIVIWIGRQSSGRSGAAVALLNCTVAQHCQRLELTTPVPPTLREVHCKDCTVQALSAGFHKGGCFLKNMLRRRRCSGPFRSPSVVYSSILINPPNNKLYGFYSQNVFQSHRPNGKKFMPAYSGLTIGIGTAAGQALIRKKTPFPLFLKKRPPHQGRTAYCCIS